MQLLAAVSEDVVFVFALEGEGGASYWGEASTSSRIAARKVTVNGLRSNCSRLQFLLKQGLFPMQSE